MKPKVARTDAAKVRELIFHEKQGKISIHESEVLDKCLSSASTTWMGSVDGKLLCVWGLIPPTLLSETAYLWLYHTEHVEEHQFLFVRHSQRMVEEMLKSYPLITGHVVATAEKSKRWLRWLGAKFGEPDGEVIPFQIRRSRG